MKTLIYIIVSFLFFLVLQIQNVYSQDHHFSQYDATYQHFNPALTGMSWDDKFDWRANTAYRSQWGAVASKPFTNQLAAFDMPYKKFGVGALIYNNRAGVGNFNAFNFMLSAAYEITMDPSNTHNLYVGLQIGLLNKSLNISNIVFDSQYSSSMGTYDPNMDSGEPMGDNSIIRFDANMGIFYKYFDKSKKYSPHIGLSLFHITKPDESLSSLTSRIPIRWAFSGGCDYFVNKLITVTPSLLLMYEAKVYDISFGAIGKYDFKNTKYKVLFGLSYRYNDAAIIHLGMHYQSFILRMSYDINISNLSIYTHKQGGLEFTLSYKFNKKH